MYLDFDKNSLYPGENTNISFNIPDDWKYFEFKNDSGSIIQLFPPSENMEIGYVMLLNKEIKDFSLENYKKIHSSIAQPVIKEKKLKESYAYSSDSVSEKGINYYEYTVEYTDENNIRWLLPSAFFNMKRLLIYSTG